MKPAIIQVFSAKEKSIFLSEKNKYAIVKPAKLFKIGGKK